MIMAWGAFGAGLALAAPAAGLASGLALLFSAFAWQAPTNPFPGKYGGQQQN